MNLILISQFVKRRPDYQKKDFNNPFYSRRDQRSASARKPVKTLLLFGLIVVVVGLFYLSNAQKFQINDIEVNGNKYLDSQEIEQTVRDQLTQRRWLFFKQSSIFFFSKKQAKAALAQSYFLERLSVKKHYFDTIVVDLEEKTSGLIWASSQKQYYLDLTGVAIREIQPTDLLFFAGQGDTDVVRAEVNSGQYPLVKDQSNREVAVGQPVISPELVSFVISLTNLIDRGADFSISHFEIGWPEAKDITLMTKEGWWVKFSLGDSAGTQFNSLSLILQQKIPDQTKLEYIDLRFGEKIFWQ